MLPTRSNGIRYWGNEIIQARSSRSGKLNRLLLKFRPLWQRDYVLQNPRRSIYREVQEREPTDCST
jgi:hypothetical protein